MDVGSYEEMVKAHKDRVYSYAVWMLRNPEEARDVAQEALIRLWEHRAKVLPVAAKSWLLTTAHRLCIDRIRRHGRRPEVEMNEQTPDKIETAAGPERLAGSAETAAAIQSALLTLNEKDRAVVVMREMQGMPYDEIAGILGVPLGTLKARLHRARERLRRELITAGVTP
jgi:RNA polymerase sigma-70 factor (ECF subfamily)